MAAATTKIRLSGDVEAIARQIAEQRGLGGVRQAVEAVLRCCGQTYLAGDCTPQPAIASIKAPIPVTPEPQIDGNAALAELGL